MSTFRRPLSHLPGWLGRLADRIYGVLRSDTMEKFYVTPEGDMLCLAGHRSTGRIALYVQPEGQEAAIRATITNTLFFADRGLRLDTNYGTFIEESARHVATLSNKPIHAPWTFRYFTKLDRHGNVQRIRKVA